MLDSVVEEEQCFFNRISSDQKILFTFIVNWFKFHMFNQKTMKDPLTSFDLKPVFLDFLEGFESDQDTPPQQSLAHSFIAFLKFISEGEYLDFKD